MHTDTGETMRRLHDRANVVLHLPAPRSSDTGVVGPSCHVGTEAKDSTRTFAATTEQSQPPAENGGTGVVRQDAAVRAYLKRHRASYWIQWLRRLITGRKPNLPGPHEAEMAERLKRVGVPTPELIAFGSQFGPGARGSSVVLTREVPNAVQLDHLLVAIDRSALGERAKRLLIRGLIMQVADLARRFHRAGYNHRDFYLCHFLAQRLPPCRVCGHGVDTRVVLPAGDAAARAAFDLVLIDLQRVLYRPPFRLRWIVKDLAQLNYSAPAGIISRTDRLRFLKAYLGINRIRWYHRWLIRWIVFKTARIGRHDRRLQLRRLHHEQQPDRRAA
jgi:hypothetical protein